VKPIAASVSGEKYQFNMEFENNASAEMQKIQFAITELGAVIYGESDGATQWEITTGAYLLSPGSWHHIALTAASYETPKAQLWIDGLAVGTYNLLAGGTFFWLDQITEDPGINTVSFGRETYASYRMLGIYNMFYNENMIQYLYNNGSALCADVGQLGLEFLYNFSSYDISDSNPLTDWGPHGLSIAHDTENIGQYILDDDDSATYYPYTSSGVYDGRGLVPNFTTTASSSKGTIALWMKPKSFSSILSNDNLEKNPDAGNFAEFTVITEKFMNEIPRYITIGGDAANYDDSHIFDADMIQMFFRSNGQVLVIKQTAVAPYYDWYFMTAENTVSMDLWNHVVLTHDGINPRLWVNNLQVTPITSGGAAPANWIDSIPTASPVGLVANSMLLNLPATQIDQLVAWDMEVTQVEVSKLWRQGRGLYVIDNTLQYDYFDEEEDSHLLLALHMNENILGEVPDSSGNSLDMQMGNSFLSTDSKIQNAVTEPIKIITKYASFPTERYLEEEANNAAWIESVKAVSFEGEAFDINTSKFVIEHAYEEAMLAPHHFITTVDIVDPLTDEIIEAGTPITIGDISQIGTGTPVPYYEWEREENEAKETIKVMKPDVIKKFVKKYYETLKATSRLGF